MEVLGDGPGEANKVPVDGVAGAAVGLGDVVCDEERRPEDLAVTGIVW